MKRWMLAAVLAGTLMLTLGPSVAAAGSQGSNATVMNVGSCVPLIDGGTVCIDLNGVVNQIVTPTGAENYVSNYREEIRVFDGGQVVWDETSEEHVHALTMDGLLKEMSSRSRFTISSFGSTFCVQYHLHGTNGEDTFVRIDFC